MIPDSQSTQPFHHQIHKYIKIIHKDIKQRLIDHKHKILQNLFLVGVIKFHKT